VVTIRERLSVSKQAMQKFDMDKFKLKKLNDMAVRAQYQVKISIDLQLWTNCMIGDEEEDTNMAWESIRENMKASAT